MEPGIRKDSLTMYFSKEVKRIVEDPKYRDSIYRQPYTFLNVANSLKTLNLRFAFWQLLNLYPKNKQQALRYIVAYDAAVATDKLLSSAFYTYALLDPRITRLEQGKPVIERPDVMDEIFHNMNEIIDFIRQYRITNPQGKEAAPAKKKTAAPAKKKKK